MSRETEKLIAYKYGVLQVSSSVDTFCGCFLLPPCNAEWLLKLTLIPYVDNSQKSLKWEILIKVLPMAQ